MVNYGAPQEMLDEQDDFNNSCKNTTKCYCGHTTMCDCIPILDLGQIVEKPKQRLEKYSERFDNKDNELVEGVFNPETWGKRLVDDVAKEESQNLKNFKKLVSNEVSPAMKDFIKEKETTLEEAADLWSIDINNVHPADSYIAKQGFISGAKWQTERSYSEEELKSAFKIGFNIGYGSPVSELDLKNEHCEKWFNKFKKKS